MVKLVQSNQISARATESTAVRGHNWFSVLMVTSHYSHAVLLMELQTTLWLYRKCGCSNLHPELHRLTLKRPKGHFECHSYFLHSVFVTLEDKQIQIPKNEPLPARLTNCGPDGCKLDWIAPDFHLIVIREGFHWKQEGHCRGPDPRTQHLHEGNHMQLEAV